LWGDFADVYIEEVKRILRGGDEQARARTLDLLLHVLDTALRLLHPYVPFITEAVWQKLPHLPADAPALIVAKWPDAGPVDDEAIARFGHEIELVRGIRNVFATHNLSPGEKPQVYITGSANAVPWLHAQHASLSALVRLDGEHVIITPTDPPKEIAAISHTFVTSNGSVVYVVPPDKSVDKNAERTRLQKEMTDLDRQIAKSEGLLISDFVSKAPEAVVERERVKLAGLKESRAKVAERLQ
jgi:valyl-tRNA synthetase